MSTLLGGRVKLQPELGLFAHTPLPPLLLRGGCRKFQKDKANTLFSDIGLCNFCKKTSESFCVRKWRLLKEDFKEGVNLWNLPLLFSDIQAR